MPDQPTPARDDLAPVLEALGEASELAISFWRRGVAKRTKADGSPVSDADLAVDQLLRRRLLEARPGYGWRSEESAEDRERERSWLVDPIDGTLGFLARDADWCIAVALIERETPLLAAVHAPALGLLFTAVRSGGAFLNGVGSR